MECSSNIIKNTCESTTMITEINNNEITHSITIVDNSRQNKNCVTKETTNDVQNFTHKAAFSQEHGSSDSSSILALVPKMENLDLSQKSHTGNGAERLAGYIRAVIPPSGTVVIQLALGCRILDVGTVIFMRCDNDANEQIERKQYSEIGFISDIFGSVFEPMYSLQLNQRDIGQSLRMDAEVFYLHEHSSTSYVTVVRDDQNRYAVIQD